MQRYISWTNSCLGGRGVVTPLVINSADSARVYAHTPVRQIRHVLLGPTYLIDPNSTQFKRIYSFI